MLTRGLIVLLICASFASAGEERFRVATDNRPQAQIAGTLWRAAGKPRGTVFMCHGYSRSMWDFRGYTWIAEQEHFNVVRFDFREHGGSSHSWHLSTLGYYEIYDLKAAIDWAEKKGLEKPYVCIGHSMGAAIALRWAGEDHRISAVLAQSPFRNAARAIDEFRPDDRRVRLAAMVLVHGGIKRMLQQVDIPRAVAKRDDLTIWLTTGQWDYFDKAEQQAILAASRSPNSMKRFTLIPGASHGGQWKWNGNDELIREFLDHAAGSSITPLRVLVVSGGVVVLLAVIYSRGGNRFRRRTSPASSCESRAG
jgi:pimeloyl-ACP methyl ester carboxylesterase